MPVTICGEMGGRPLEALALLALGIDRLSITPAAVLPIKAMVRTAALIPLRAMMDEWLDAPGSNIRELLRCAADAQGVVRG